MPALPVRKTHWALCALLLFACLVLGGGQGTLGDTACQLLALVVLGFAFWRHAADERAGFPRIALLALVPLALPLLQLVPLSEGMWLVAPARGALAEDLAVAGISDPVMRATLSPMATERALFWLLPMVAMFLSTLQFDQAQRRSLVVILVAFALFSVILGIAQLAGGTTSPLRPYAITNANEAVGLFANRNHFAGLLAVSIPFVLGGTAMWRDSHLGEPGAGRSFGVIAGIVVTALMILGVALARSRAGLVLGMLAIVLSGVLLTRFSAQRGARRWLLVAIGVGLVLSVQFALFGILKRLDDDPLDNARLRFLPITMEVAATHLPYGAGIGSFRRAYEAADEVPGEDYVNHAHDDYAELWLDGGWLTVAAFAAPLLYAAVAFRRSHSRVRAAPAELLSRLAMIGLFLIAVHSLADYPLRTGAMQAVLGLLAGAAFARAATPVSRKPTERILTSV